MSIFGSKPNFKNFPDIPSNIPKPTVQGIPGVADFIEGVFGRRSAGTPGTSIKGPWFDQPTGVKGTFFPPLEIVGGRWDKLYPYRLVVVEQQPDGRFGIVSSSGGNLANTKAGVSSPGRFSLVFEPVGNKWEYRLPITFQQLSVSNQFAIQTSSTLRGIVEEHNGTKFKMISCSGSFGVWPNRSSVDPVPGDSSPGILNTLFGGSIQAFSDLTNQVNRTINTFTSGHPASKPTTPDVASSTGGYQGTGYAQALLLDQFLEQYSEKKKDPKNANWRLALDMPKQNQTFLVTPVMFNYSQSADTPNEYKFQLQLKAWRRVSLTESIGTKFSEFNTGANSPDFLRRLLNGIREARLTLASAYNLVKAVRSDFQTPFNALRELTILVKDLSGLPGTVADLPRQIVSDARYAIADAANNLDQASIQFRASNQKIKNIFKNLQNSRSSREGVSNSYVASGQIGVTAISALSTDPSNVVFENPEQNFEFFDSFNITDVNFPESIQDAIDADQETNALLTVDEVHQHRQTLLDLALQISNTFGTGDETYSRIYNKPSPLNRLQEVSLDEYDVLKKLYDLIQLLSTLTTTDALNERNTQSAYEYVQELANDFSLPFEDSRSKVRAPVPFGLSMEQISARYLNDPDRWLEIATLNNLKSPYIDEIGFELPFLSNASGRQFNVSNSTNLYSGQKIQISSNNQPIQRRKIVSIEKISDTNFLVTVDGLANLDVFTTAQSAKMKAYLPGTVNSQDQIYIPADFEPSDDLITRPVPATSNDALTGLSKIDWLLTEDGDIAIDAFGDFRLAYGLNNLIQALKIKISTPPGRLLKNPGFGAGINHGISTADTSASDIYSQIATAIQSDSRFSSVDRMEIIVQGPTMTVNLSVSIANGQGVFPLSFQLSA